MTEFWKSNPNYWCEVCKVWLQDTKAARLNHERGEKHKLLLAKKIRAMGKRADEEKRVEQEAAKSMDSIEAAAAKKYKADLAEQGGTWAWQEATGYFYNAKHRWYFDPKTAWYYGGEPAPTWTHAPAIPEAAMFGTAPREGGPDVSTTVATQPAAPPTSAAARPAGVPTSAAAKPAASVAKKVINVPAHPLSEVGGYQMPTGGTIGAAKGVGAASDSSAAGKRKREEPGKGTTQPKPVTKEEAEALAKREAARQRVAQRTLGTFGLS